MRLVFLILLAVVASAGPARAQVIKGESTDDSAYAPRPAARWHSPESRGVVPDDRREEDARDQGVHAERPRN